MQGLSGSFLFRLTLILDILFEGRYFIDECFCIYFHVVFFFFFFICFRVVGAQIGEDLILQRLCSKGTGYGQVIHERRKYPFKCRAVFPLPYDDQRNLLNLQLMDNGVKAVDIVIGLFVQTVNKGLGGYSILYAAGYRPDAGRTIYIQS